MYEIYCQLRDAKGCKDAEVARCAGVAKSTLSDWKSGKSNPKQDKLAKIAKYFEVSVEYLMTGKEPQPTFAVEMAEIDLQLSNQSKRLKEYMLKLAELPKDKQENILNLIDMLREGK